LTEIEQLQVEPDLAAKVVIDERSGIIVMGRDVRVSTVAVAQGNLTVTISETPQVSQPQPFSRGQTVVVPRTRVGVSEDGRHLTVVKEGVSLQQLVDGLNSLGIGPRELIAILQAIKAQFLKLHVQQHVRWHRRRRHLRGRHWRWGLGAAALSEQYAKTFAKAGGIGIADHVYRTLIAAGGAGAC
jgi:hypothetical protein